MIALSTTTEEMNAAQNALALARYQQAAYSDAAGSRATTQQTSQYNSFTSRRWGGRDYHHQPEQASRTGSAA